MYKFIFLLHWFGLMFVCQSVQNQCQSPFPINIYWKAVWPALVTVYCLMHLLSENCLLFVMLTNLLYKTINVIKNIFTPEVSVLVLVLGLDSVFSASESLSEEEYWKNKKTKKTTNVCWTLFWIMLSNINNRYRRKVHYHNFQD